MNKNAVFFVCHFYNDFAKSQFQRVIDNLPENYDVYYCTNNNVIDSFKKDFTCYDIIGYENEDIKSADGAWNPLHVVEDAYLNNEVIRNYNKYYVIEYDVYATPNWKTIFELTNDNDVDLYAAYIKKLPYTNTTGWIWANKYVDSHEVCPDDNIKTLLKSCLSYMVLSNNALDFIVHYDKSDIKDYIYEMYVPTLLYNNNFTIKSLSSNKNEDNEEFNYVEILNPKTYYYCVSFNDSKEMDDISNGKTLLFTTYKEQRNTSIIRNFDEKTCKIDMSVVMSVYNGEKYLKEAIESVLNQENAPSYEFIIINDGSTDKTNEIIKEYIENNERIVYINKEHNGLVNSLNAGIKNALGKYIVRFDADDIMFKDRLAVQYEYMEANTDIDICGFGFEWGNGKPVPEYFSYGNPNITLQQLANSNCIGHPTVIMRKSSIDTLPFLYESYFKHCEDYKLWCTAASHGLKIASNPTPVMYYRQHDDQITKNNETCTILWQKTDIIKQIYSRVNKPTEGDITVIIPFKNEGYEIEKTVASVRGTAPKNVPIILINDGSEDGYDYKWIADTFNCVYIENKESIGVAQSRDLGVEKSETPYFMLLDGHMRFYQTDWYDKIIEYLTEHPTSILSSETTVISKNKNDEYSNEDGESHYSGAGAYVNMEEEGWQFTGKWTHVKLPGYEDKELLPTSCIMGACYCSTKTWWTYIGGLYGLILWGQDEPLISIKSWLAGGDVFLMKNIRAGHVYREKAPYNFPANKIYSNSIWLNHLFGENNIELYDKQLKDRIGQTCFNEAMDFYKEHEEDCEKFKQVFWNDIAVHDMKWYYELNDKCFEHKK